ncbi:T9SS type A sorting domain-containing protein [Algibacter lectus]|uniref:T9SS type A sorting domain-containing protein n=1 Tax=Algibacter lectus TaxID=221126 RepID=UPI0008DF1399|nr:T9SS type A sorting domain-containing protein [Algibacter lectus]MDO7135944.1 T9SS type A sorting domain-containing protein [Algibacter lectus]SFB98229.1 Por secretion system C-terminal sorting domain-containing protein [Algibacter lectus]
MKNTTFVVSLLFATHLIYSQETIPASGGEAIGSGGSSSYSVGQLVYTSNTGSGTITQGVQQSVELFTLSNPELTTVNLTAVTYPNPTSDYVVLAISDANLTDLSYSLYDLQGKEITKGQATQSNMQIEMQHLATGTYVLKVNQNNQELKTFKIIKK